MITIRTDDFTCMQTSYSSVHLMYLSYLIYECQTVLGSWFKYHQDEVFCVCPSHVVFLCFLSDLYFSAVNFESASLSCLTFQVQRYEGDLAQLGLYFVIENNEYGEQVQVELLPGGKDIQVDNDNVIRYIHLVANYRLNTQVCLMTCSLSSK